jgi:DNA-binding transcriptional ArsR family regulator
MDVDRSDSFDADDSFGLLGNEIRLAIVRELGDAWEPESRDPVPFSELRRAVGTADSGQFDYHLGKLRGSFVERTEDGYHLTYPGVKVYQTIKAGTFTERVTVEPFDLEATCFDCGGGLRGAYEGHLFRIVCRDCERRYYNYFLPPGQVVAADRETVLDTLDQAIRRDLTAGAAGVCPNCTGRVEVAVGPDVGYIFERGDRPFDAHAGFDCTLCGSHFESTVGGALVDHPALVEEGDERGVDLSDAHLWTLAFADDGDRTALRLTEPTRVGVTARHEGDEITLVVDDGLDVVAVERDG